MTPTYKSVRHKKQIIVLAVISTIIFALILFRPKIPRPPESVSNISELEVYLEKLVDFGTPPGMSMVVVSGESVVYSKGFGWADRPREIRATPRTVYHWWSITKIATAMAVFQLQEKKKLKLDDSVAKYLPYFRVSYPAPQNNPVTIRNLLNHSSGMPDAGFRIMNWIHHDGEPHYNQTDLLREVLPGYSDLKFETGDHSRYTNIGYMVLGAIIEKVTNQTYENYIRQNILLPLGMRNTDFIYTKKMEADEAAGSHPVFDGWTILVPFLAGSYLRETSGNHLWFRRVYTNQTPPSGLIGSAEDAARLALAYLNKGKFEGTRILGEKSIDIMTNESHLRAKNPNPESSRRQGLGWQVYNGKRGTMLTHAGGGLGFSTVMQLYPDEKLGLILFTNDVKCKGWRILNLAATLDW